FDLADPARKHSRLGVADPRAVSQVADEISGAMFHCNCENDSLESFSKILDRIAADWGPLLKKLDWVSLGGGIAFTSPGYPVEQFAERLAAFSQRFGVQVYLEPGEAAITRSTYLVTRVIDIVKNDVDIAIVDAAVEPHLLDLLIYRTPARMDLPRSGKHRYEIGGRTCLAGDVFGTFDFPEPLEIGSLVSFADTAGYSMVKKNWFNGVAMPSIVVRRLDGKIDVVRNFGYEEYQDALS
ncbi:MAG: carboxynorspermidine decarboxylase, partial [Elusimicrobia bacterium]|nr:carboxynorspermidine decarboxylase [Elusimicrobiota bacterium]